MSIQQALIVKFADRIEHNFQQKISLLRDKVRIGEGVGLQVAFNTMNPTDVQEITGLINSRTAWQDIDQFNRWAAQQAFNHPTMISRYHDLAALADLRQPYVMAGVMAHLRNIDDVLITAALGTAVQGQTPGASPASTFNTAAPENDGGGGNLIAAGGTGMTPAKLKTALGTMLTRNVGVDGMGSLESGSFTAMMGGYQMKQLLDATDVTSWDFVGNLGPNNMPNVAGFVARYAGFDIIVTNRLPVVSGARRCIVWHRDSMGLALWGGSAAQGASMSAMEGSATTGTFYVTVDRMPDFNNAMGAQVMANFGAVRILDLGVLAIDCTE